MNEPLFWNPLPAAAAWLTERTGRAFDARSVVDAVASMGTQGDGTPTIIKATLPRELTYAVIATRALNRGAPVPENLALNEKFGLPKGVDYVKATWPTTAPLAVNALLDLITYGQIDLSVFPGAVATNRHESVWLMPFGTTHRATLETCGINRDDLLALGDALAADTQQPAPVVAEPEPMPAIKKDGYVLKKAAAIKKYSDTWKTIESDLNHANDNGLSKAAKAPIHGEWYETALLAWADSKGKRDGPKPEREVVNSVFNLPGTKHTLQG